MKYIVPIDTTHVSPNIIEYNSRPPQHYYYGLAGKRYQFDMTLVIVSNLDIRFEKQFTRKLLNYLSTLKRLSSNVKYEVMVGMCDDNHSG